MKVEFYENQIAGLKEKPGKGTKEQGVLAFATSLALSLRKVFGFEEMLSEIQFRYKIRKVLYITFYWMVVRLAQDFYDMLVMSNYSGEAVELNYAIFVLSNIIASFLGGIIGGSIIIFYIEKIWRTKSLGLAVAAMSVSYTILFVLVVGIAELIYQCYLLQLPVYHSSVIFSSMDYFVSIDFIKNYLTWWMISIATIVILQVNDKYGPGALTDLILGNYHKPKSEERIFLFLDLRSSTSTAEQLGEETYFNYIQDFFVDTTDAILETKGEIYQYVGDEIIVSWKMKNGIDRANVLRCFFSIQNAIEKRKEYYLKKYNRVPGFKAGIHSGKVTTGEIGIVKKEITFTGDVLNTTSRIQEKCNAYGRDLLISNELLRMLPLGENMKSENIGEISLRGKESKVALSTVKIEKG